QYPGSSFVAFATVYRTVSKAMFTALPVGRSAPVSLRSWSWMIEPAMPVGLVAITRSLVALAARAALNPTGVVPLGVVVALSAVDVADAAVEAMLLEPLAGIEPAQVVFEPKFARKCFQPVGGALPLVPIESKVSLYPDVVSDA